MIATAGTFWCPLISIGRCPTQQKCSIRRRTGRQVGTGCITFEVQSLHFGWVWWMARHTCTNTRQKKGGFTCKFKISTQLETMEEKKSRLCRFWYKRNLSITKLTKFAQENRSSKERKQQNKEEINFVRYPKQLITNRTKDPECESWCQKRNKCRWDTCKPKGTVKNGMTKFGGSWQKSEKNIRQQGERKKMAEFKKCKVIGGEKWRWNAEEMDG